MKSRDSKKGPPVSLDALCKGLGVEYVLTVDSYDLKQVEEAVKKARRKINLRSSSPGGPAHY
ncbi:hypothetical protein D2962_12755 [Biomaibacter acetigenes]|uniref:Uncharacterized protein n=1 Tax=Biomaibacter acetigenes TaxID=2316383 RepID=A0A3G2R7H5_9FIRM|nr:thiamine pyrophosphate-dependent enzyme [Biomaibacter acetigenes]AYO31353.1 hypothetical protein D2962_12755 [Biomaibacter acetigenes]